MWPSTNSRAYAISTGDFVFLTERMRRYWDVDLDKHRTGGR